MSVFFHPKQTNKKKHLTSRIEFKEVLQRKKFVGALKKKVLFLLLYIFCRIPLFFFFFLFLFVCYLYIAACGASGLARLLIIKCLILEQEAELRVKMFRQGRTLPPSGRRYAYLWGAADILVFISVETYWDDDKLARVHGARTHGSATTLESTDGGGDDPRASPGPKRSPSLTNLHHSALSV